jgi:hypothetical protein
MSSATEMENEQESPVSVTEETKNEAGAEQVEEEEEAEADATSSDSEVEEKKETKQKAKTKNKTKTLSGKAKVEAKKPKKKKAKRAVRNIELFRSFTSTKERLDRLRKCLIANSKWSEDEVNDLSDPLLGRRLTKYLGCVIGDVAIERLVSKRTTVRDDEHNRISSHSKEAIRMVYASLVQDALLSLYEETTASKQRSIQEAHFDKAVDRSVKIWTTE